MDTTSWIRRCGAAGLIATGVLGTAACGYTLAGQGSFLPEYIETIGIPMFENNTTAFDIEQRITQEVRREFIARGSFRVVPDTTGVDALLNGSIQRIEIEPASFTGDQQVSRFVFTVTAGIEFLDLTNDTIIWENPRLEFSDEYEVASGASVETAFFGQRSNAVERIAVDFSEAVVSSILEAF